MSSRTSDGFTRLRPRLGTVGATLMGLGSILGTGVFVSLAIAAGISGPSVILATLIAALVATCNALSSVQLAAAHPVSGGTYEYGYRYLSPMPGFTAGWMFLCAKTASAATAALGCAGYVLNLIGEYPEQYRIGLAAGIALILTAIAAGGIKSSTTVNVIMVAITISSLVAFVIAVAPSAWANAGTNFVPFFHSLEEENSVGALRNLIEACALVFVAFTGYGRIATLGEEVHDPKRTIPRAIITTLIVTTVLYLGVAIAAVAAAGAATLGSTTTETAAPLEIVARDFGLPGFHWLVALGAVTAMTGVLLNLILGLSRVLLAMGRRGDAPALLANVNAKGTTPYVAVWLIGAMVIALTLIGNVKTTWSFSAFAVLIYYAITNLAALRLPPDSRLYSRAWAWAGLASCLFLAFWVEMRVWVIGLGLIGVGILWRLAVQRFAQKQ